MHLKDPVDVPDLNLLLENKRKNLSRLEGVLKTIEDRIVSLHAVDDPLMRELVGRSVYSLRADIEKKSKSYKSNYDWSSTNVFTSITL